MSWNLSLAPSSRGCGSHRCQVRSVLYCTVCLHVLSVFAVKTSDTRFSSVNQGVFLLAGSCIIQLKTPITSRTAASASSLYTVHSFMYLAVPPRVAQSPRELRSIGGQTPPSDTRIGLSVCECFAMFNLYLLVDLIARYCYSCCSICILILKVSFSLNVQTAIEEQSFLLSSNRKVG